MSDKTTYYKENRERVLKRTKEYYKNSKERSREQATNKYRELSDEKRI